MQHIYTELCHGSWQLQYIMSYTAPRWNSRLKNDLYFSWMSSTDQEWPLLIQDVLNWPRMTSISHGCPHLPKNDLYCSRMSSTDQEWPLLLQDVINWSRMTLLAPKWPPLPQVDLQVVSLFLVGIDLSSLLKCFCWKNVWFSHRCKYIKKTHQCHKYYKDE